MEARQLRLLPVHAIEREFDSVPLGIHLLRWVSEANKVKIDKLLIIPLVKNPKNQQDVTTYLVKNHDMMLGSCVERIGLRLTLLVSESHFQFSENLRFGRRCIGMRSTLNIAKCVHQDLNQ